MCVAKVCVFVKKREEEEGECERKRERGGERERVYASMSVSIFFPFSCVKVSKMRKMKSDQFCIF